MDCQYIPLEEAREGLDPFPKMRSRTMRGRAPPTVVVDSQKRRVEYPADVISEEEPTGNSVRKLSVNGT